MRMDQLRDEAVKRVKDEYPDCEILEVRPYENIMDGTLFSVAYKTKDNPRDSTHLHFRKGETRIYRWHGDVIAAVSAARERVWFFRFIELAGVGGVIAFILVLVFSGLLCTLAFSNSNPDPSILEVVKLSFTVILGFFFGSQSAGK